MASFLTDLVMPYVEKLINGAITESSYICCFTCIAKDFEDEKAKLEVERTNFNQLVDIAIRGGEDVQASALSWEKQADELIQEDTKTKQKCFFGFCCNCIWQYRRGKELSNKNEQIKKLTETRKELAIGLPAHLPDIERYSSQHFIPFKSRESKCKELLDALTDDNNYIVGLQGMGGTGKTTLAKEVGKKLKQSKQFTQVIDTTVSFSPDNKNIQDDIAGPLGLKFDDCNESDRPKKLWSRLTNGEKILIMLDDVWGYIDFDKIGIPQSDNRKGCSVFVTARDLKVCNKLGCSRTIQLDLLSEEDAWIMFQWHAGLSQVSKKKLLDKGHKIANECKRLPVAIAAIASSLKGEQRLEKWDVALNSLQKHISIGGVDEDLVDIYKCLKFSYDYLKNKNVEELFLLCSVFQEDEEISIQILTRLGIGVGLFGEGYEKYNNARNLVVVAKDKLLDSCLLLKTYKGGVKMHDLIREVAQWIANKDTIQVVSSSTKNLKSLVGRDNNIKYFLFDGNPKDLFSFRFDGSKLMILIFNMGRGSFEDVPVLFFENIAGLRVLTLIADNQTLALPQSIRLLTNIRSLLVESADLGDISVLESLQSLETLDLKYCKIDKLPEEIAKLKELRLLNLEYCRIASNNPFEVIKRCPSLEELYFRNSFDDFCWEITLPAALERYHICDDFGQMDDSLSKCVSLEKNDLSEATYKYVMQTVERLNLGSIEKGWRNIMPEIVPIDEGMNDLIELYLRDHSHLQCLVDTEHIGSSQVPNVFSKLVVLELSTMSNLKELCNGHISTDSMNNLENVDIRDCENLRSLFKGILNLCRLKTLKIISCPKLVSVFHLSTSGSLSFLEEMYISECEQLENIFTCERRRVDDAIEEILVPNLKFVKIKRCDKLTYVFDQQVKLDSLIELELNDVSNFKDIFPKSDNSISKPQTQLQLQVEEEEAVKSNIFSWTPICCFRTTSTKVPSVVSQDHPQACSISTETSSYCFSIWERAQCLSSLSHILCNIKVIKLEMVSNIKSVFMLSIAPKMSLESLTIQFCHDLEHTVVDCGDCSGGNELGINVFPKLKELKVEYCRKLKYIFGHINASDDHDHDHDQNNNEIQHQLHLPVLKSLTLLILQSLIGMCPKQYHTTFPSLKELKLCECSQVDVKSIGDFTFLTSISRYQDSTTIKQFSGNIEHFLALERVEVSDCNVESILCLNEESDVLQINLGLQNMILGYLPMMISLFVGPKNAFPLKNLKSIIITRCKNLEIVFSTSVLRCLSQLSHLKIKACNELKHIIEDDEDDIENGVSSKTCCFPVLKILTVVKCNKLKSVFPISMIIWEADELEEIFKSVADDDHKVEIPNLKVVVFLNLPKLCHAHGIQFKTIENHFVQNCKKLSLTSLRSSMDVCHDLKDLIYGIDRDNDLWNLFRELKDMPKDSDFEDLCNENPQKEMNQTPAAEYEFNENVTDLAIPSAATLPTNSQELISEQSTSQQHSLGQIDTTSQLSQGDYLEGSMSIISETRNVPPVHLVDLKQKGIQVSVEEGIASTSYANTIASSTHHLESEYGDGEIAVPFSVSTTECHNIEDVNLGDSHETTQTNNQVSLNDDAFLQVSSTIQQQFPKDDEIIVSGLWMPSAVNSPTNSQELMNEQSMHQQRFNQERPLGEIDATIKFSQGMEICVEDGTTSPTHSKSVSSCSSSGLSTTSKLETSLPLEGSTTSEKNVAANLSSISETKNEPHVQLVGPKQKGVEGGAKLTNAKTITSSTHLELVSSSQEQNVDVRDFQETTKTNNDQVPLNGEAFMKVSSIIEEQFSKEDPSPSNSIPLPFSFETHSMPFQGNPSQKVEDLSPASMSIAIAKPLTTKDVDVKDSSSPSTVIWELEQLVSKNCLDYKNLSLLTDFLVKHPSVLLRDTSLGNKYKGYAYICLAELLQFLQTHSVLDVLGSSRSEFVELLQEVRSFDFDKDWLDSVERRALFSDIQVSQDALQKLLESKQQVSKEVEVLRMKIDIFNHHVEDLKHQLTSSEAILESIILQEAQVLETKAALSAPLGY